MPICQVCSKTYILINASHLKRHGLTHKEYKGLYPNAEIADKDFLEERGRRISRSLDTPEIKRRRSERMKQQYKDGKMVAAYSEEALAKRAEKIKDYWANLSDEERAKISRQRSEIAKELHASGIYGEDYCKALSDALLAYYQTDEGKKNREDKVNVMSERMIAWYADPDNKELCSRLRSEEMTRRMADPEERKKISQAMKKWWNEHPEHQEKMARVRAAQSQNGPTSIELVLYNLLDRLSLQYTTQIVIGKYAVDALIEGWLAIEADGDYWHSLPGIAERDERKNQYLWERGYQILRFWGSDLRDNLEMCANRITFVMECT